jgi:hypothetical protein
MTRAAAAEAMTGSSRMQVLVAGSDNGWCLDGRDCFGCGGVLKPGDRALPIFCAEIAVICLPCLKQIVRGAPVDESDIIETFEVMSRILEHG